ncbi:hypothetical protein GLOIN_2v1878910 [Rhizophagus irregularis DAOM 181602=DAOM 197198]|uniref:Uncharacterized protein n=1 Tax=Rhizophagus irregularis (strain DAOM 181602 / DAOM 197198 / MUCL 43194) TaxID=747089 RepID=A0A2P4PQK6_RHIID|nr:hypothetical protein GLOIN_2v1878910 [Rhizophagus irregularis DAOM 181602=DAOM 197198]PKY12922.1 hypothetical protein RhiirB3_398140 [Rhizophagus irregularis]POG67642.1 hypothetical protein GLOIN_2v1878910 [Rhizophagus irregularis DAOM 181602=DAOM 197198]GET57184.1 hypothetical protein GLOIN_2v1878910 [Rhizophagus irregularis DAOM 181602=DAOM 197198]|eukprot:XP_025174508.1 hypothetical protein GLOIN_2v1878910 [Rhizophagus irregularis DAOM 181602=DAOM 197198]
MIFLESKYNFVLVFLMMVLVLISQTYCIPQGGTQPVTQPDTPPPSPPDLTPPDNGPTPP